MNPKELYETKKSSLGIPRDEKIYFMDAGLEGAVESANLLRIPLLVTGEPGTGKTMLARHLAHKLSLTYYEFQAKTTSCETDLFYRYDTLRRFRDIHEPDRRLAKPLEYLEFAALGKAILRAMDRNDNRIEDLELRENSRSREYVRGEAAQSLVLIDEIDKAPRDLPNDLLTNIEEMQFTAPDIHPDPFKASPEMRPVVIITSNSERELPEAFLRRCAYYHIPFPGSGILYRILTAHGLAPELSAEALKRFLAIRRFPLMKRPATGELLGWALALDRKKVGVGDLRDESPAASALDSLLIKTRPDRDQLTAEEIRKKKSIVAAEIADELKDAQRE